MEGNPALKMAQALQLYRNALLDSGFTAAEAMLLLVEMQKALITGAIQAIGPQLSTMFKDFQGGDEKA